MQESRLKTEGTGNASAVMDRFLVDDIATLPLVGDVFTLFHRVPNRFPVHVYK